MIAPFTTQQTPNPVQSTVQATNQGNVGAQSKDIDQAAPKENTVQPEGTAVASSFESEGGDATGGKRFSSSSSTENIEYLVEKAEVEHDRARGSLVDEEV